MGYDRADSFPFDIEPNEIPFGSKSKEKLSPRSYPIQCERKWKYSFLSVSRDTLMGEFPILFSEQLLEYVSVFVLQIDPCSWKSFVTLVNCDTSLRHFDTFYFIP